MHKLALTCQVLYDKDLFKLLNKGLKFCKVIGEKLFGKNMKGLIMKREF